MNILLDLGHPAHVHLFRHMATAWQDRGHKVVIAARDKDITVDLLERLGMEFSTVSTMRHSRSGLFFELIEHTWGVYQLARKHRCSTLLGTSVSIGPASKLLRSYSLFFNEDDADCIKTVASLAHPTVDAIVTPSCLPDDLGGKHIVYDSYHELVYLHPNRFDAQESVLDDLGVTQGEKYFVIRLVALNAVHDTRQAGISRSLCREVISRLNRAGRVYITAEGELEEEFRPYQISIEPEKMHDVLAFATLVVSDSQTMTAEAAVLGTPSLRYNSFVGRISYLEELEGRYGLTFGFKIGQESDFIARLGSLLAHEDLRDEWQQRRAKMLGEKIDPLPWMVRLVEEYEARVAPEQARKRSRWMWPAAA